MPIDYIPDNIDLAEYPDESDGQKDADYGFLDETQRLVLIRKTFFQSCDETPFDNAFTVS